MEHSSAAATTTLLRRSNFQGNQNHGTSTTPKKSHLNLDTLSSSSYTSLKDMLPFSAAAVVNSPTAASSSSASSADISIRNRLVKQAAWAYLQPMSPSPCGPSGPLGFLRRLRHRFSSESQHRHRLCRRNPLSPCFSFVSRIASCFTRILHQVLHAFRGEVPTL